MTVQITILGLGRMGTSIGLSLAQIKDQVVRVGNDREPAIARQAEKMGAIDKTFFNIPAAVRNADVVILALPIDEIRLTLEAAAPDLKPGSVLIDTSPVKSVVSEWAKELLPGKDRYFVGFTPSLNPAYLLESGDNLESAHADLFQNSLMLINTLPGIDESAISLATNLAQVMGANPLFADAAEADGLAAYTNLLPRLVSAALVNTTIDQPGWREARKMAGPVYAQVTEAALHAEGDQSWGQAALLNKENTIRILDQMLLELRSMRDMISGDDSEGLLERLEQAHQGRQQWFAERMQGDWDNRAKESAGVPTSGDFIGRLFGVRPKKEKK